MKKGFTLIELLAVIVILAIIAVIAVPIVLNIIDETKNNATLRSADFYLDAVEMSVAQATLKNQNVPDGTYNILESGNICLEYTDTTCTEELVVEVNGEKPTEGTITIVGGEILHSEIKINEKEIIKNNKNEVEYVKMLDEVCTPVSTTTTGNIPTGNYEQGDEYKCKVDPNMEEYTFFILSKEENRINLIMDSNIRKDGIPVKDTTDLGLVAWITKDDYLSSGGRVEDWNMVGNNNKGPVTAIEYLASATANWTNLNTMIINKYTDDTGAAYDMGKMFTTYARLPHYNEISNVSTSMPWLLNYLNDGTLDVRFQPNMIPGVYGYWTLSATSNSIYSSDSWQVFYGGFIDYGGYMGSDVYNDGYYGVRPVITLKIN